MADDYFRAGLDQMIDLQHPLALLAKRLPWDAIEAHIIPLLSCKNRSGYFSRTCKIQIRHLIKKMV